MKKFVCTVCGYVHEGDSAPEKCPQCGVGADKFKEQAGEKTWAAEHVVGVAKGNKAWPSWTAQGHTMSLPQT